MHKSTHTIGAVAFLATLVIVVLCIAIIIDPALARVLFGSGR